MALGLGVVAFNIGFEVVWLYVYRGRQVLRTLTGEFTLESDFFTPVPASLQLVLLTLAVPLLVATLRPRRTLARRVRLFPVAATEKPLSAGVASG